MNKLLFLSVILICTVISNAQNSVATEMESDLAKLNRELDNPLAKRWSLVFQENYAINKGTAINGNVSSNTFFFQPALPIPFGNNKVFTARPVFPIVTQADFAADASGKSKVSGFGDIQMAALMGPGNVSGWVWGVGATFVFPTASRKEVGQGKFQLGPTIMLFHLAKKWNKGFFMQHWWSVAGDNDRKEVILTDLQYVLRRNFGAQSIGMGPSVKIDWTKPFSNGFTFPIGLGYTKTIKIGNTPYKIRFEPQYSLIRPDNYGNAWNIRFQIAPVIRSPFIST